jgi:hypothetical protein
MRLLTAAVLMVFAASPAFAEDKNEDKAKEVSLAFLKALKAKDLDAVMKTVDVPFLFMTEQVEKTDDLKAKFKAFFEKVSPDKVPSEVGSVLDVPALRKKFGDNDTANKKIDEIEKLLGKTGYAVLMKRGEKETEPLFVQVKDGKAKVVGIPK